MAGPNFKFSFTKYLEQLPVFLFVPGLRGSTLTLSSSAIDDERSSGESIICIPDAVLGSEGTGVEKFCLEERGL